VGVQYKLSAHRAQNQQEVKMSHLSLEVQRKLQWSRWVLRRHGKIVTDEDLLAYFSITGAHQALVDDRDGTTYKPPAGSCPDRTPLTAGERREHAAHVEGWAQAMSRLAKDGDRWARREAARYLRIASALRLPQAAMASPARQGHDPVRRAKAPKREFSIATSSGQDPPDDPHDQESPSEPKGFDRPLDRALEALRAIFPEGDVYRPHPEEHNVWFARCPFCRCQILTLEITERKGGIAFDCWSGCEEQLIRLVLGFGRGGRPSRPLTLAEALSLWVQEVAA
jgi:hypothetical protein